MTIFKNDYSVDFPPLSKMESDHCKTKSKKFEKWKRPSQRERFPKTPIASKVFCEKAYKKPVNFKLPMNQQCSSFSFSEKKVETKVPLDAKRKTKNDKTFHEKSSKESFKYDKAHYEKVRRDNLLLKRKQFRRSTDAEKLFTTTKIKDARPRSQSASEIKIDEIKEIKAEKCCTFVDQNAKRRCKLRRLRKILLENKKKKKKNRTAFFPAKLHKTPSQHVHKKKSDSTLFGNKQTCIDGNVKVNHHLQKPGNKDEREEILLANCPGVLEMRPCEMIYRLSESHFLDHQVCEAGEVSEEFMELYKKLVLGGDWCYYLADKGVLQHLATLIEKEIEQFSRLEQTRLSSDLALGYAVKQLTSLLASLLQHGSIKAAFKSRLVSAVLGGYLSLRRLIVQRTKMVDVLQDNLLELLEDLTTGTEEETRAFMAVCVETVQRYPPDDHLTPVFIFERLCSIILPEEADTGEFFLSLEKDNQQEEFLQGRMLGNPYSSQDSNLGPLMREVKNKICTDCELVALLEDDNGMELFGSNKIINLPVKGVYNKVWLPEAGEGEATRVVYGMRGLLGDATEEFFESLDKEGEAEDDEVTYRLAKVMGQCGGLKVLLLRMVSVTSLANKTLLAVLLKLLGYCCKMRSNRSLMLEPGLGTTRILLGTLQLCLTSGEQQHQSSTTETVLDLMEKLMVEAAASHDSVDSYRAFASASANDINNLLEHAVRLKPGKDLHQGLMRVLPFLTYTNRNNLTLVINHFNDVIDFKKFDLGHNAEDEANLEAWVALCDGIERNELGNTMKDELVRLGIVARCTDYIKQHLPPTTQVLLRTDDPAWMEFSMKPSVKCILCGLAGLAKDHPATQLANTVIAPLHLMEQMSSDEHLGSLAEAVLEALKGHPEAAAKVKQARTATRQEKKKLAKAMRAKQLKAIGLKTNDKGQVKAESANLEKYQAIGEESGLSCVICREGYKFQPGKVLAVYTFTRRCVLEDHEKTTRKTMGFTTVSHFNLVHVDCHLAAVRQARARDEWESALLQNANTKCNGLLPLCGPGVSEFAFASCLARHNTYLAEATGQRDISYQESFSEDCGGGGPQSNLHLLPYLAHMTLYVINTTRAGPREIHQLNSWVSLALLLLSPHQWKKKRVTIFQRLLLAAHVQVSVPATSCVACGITLETTKVHLKEGHEEMTALHQCQSLNFNMETQMKENSPIKLSCCSGHLEVAGVLMKLSHKAVLWTSEPVVENVKKGHLEFVRILLHEMCSPCLQNFIASLI